LIHFHVANSPYKNYSKSSDGSGEPCVSKLTASRKRTYVGIVLRSRRKNKMKAMVEEKKSQCKECTDGGGRHNQISGKENL